MPELLPKLALLAGGLATRLRPLTETLPKSLVPVAGTPFLARQLALIASHGIREIVICTGHLSDQIEAFAGNGSRFECNIVYSHDGDSQLGTGGALKRAVPLLGECFFVMYGDSYLLADPAQAWKAFLASGKPALMTVFRNAGKWDASNVEMRDGKIVCYSKRALTKQMRYIDYGLSIVRAQILRDWPESTPFDLADVMELLAAQGNLVAHEVHDRFYEIGSNEGLRATEEYFATSRVQSALPEACQ